MASLEAMMAGLFGDMQAPAGDEMRRRRGQGGTGGPQQLPGMMQQYYGGAGGYDFSGAMGRDFAGDGGRGLMAMLGQQGRDLKGPALRHFANQGFDFMNQGRGQDNRERPGGPNVAPGNIDNAQALFQPQGAGFVPGVPQGVGVQTAPGQMRPRPQTQGWRNVHPGYSAAAAYGTDQSGAPQFGGQRPPAAAGAPPGASTGGQGPGGGGGGGAPQSQNAVGGGGAPVRPGAGGGGGGTGGGQASGGKNTGGGAPAGVTPAVKQQAAGQSTARGGYSEQQAADRQTAGRIAKGAGGKDLGGSPMLDALGAIQDLGKQPKPPNRGNNATPSELNSQTGKLSGLSAAEKAARKSSWEAKVAAKQEKQRASVAAKSGQYAAPDSRGMGTAPLPKAGKTRPVSKKEVAARKGRAV